MFARWNRMAKQFTRVAKDIAIAVHAGGPDPAANPTLRRILQNARAVNMPKDKTDAAIRRASGKEAANYQEILYEGYAPHGVALLVETATDNPTRTVGSLRNIFTKGAGNLGNTGSVSFLFKKMGVFRLDPASVKDQDELELDLIDYGLEEMGESSGEKGEPQLVIRCAFHDFGKLQEALEARGIAPLSAEHEYICSVPIELPEDQAAEVLRSSTSWNRTTTSRRCSTRWPDPLTPCAPTELVHPRAHPAPPPPDPGITLRGTPRAPGVLARISPQCSCTPRSRWHPLLGTPLLLGATPLACVTPVRDGAWPYAAWGVGGGDRLSRWACANRSTAAARGAVIHHAHRPSEPPAASEVKPWSALGVIHPPRLMVLGHSQVGIDRQLDMGFLAAGDVIAGDFPLVVGPGVHVVHAPVEGDVVQCSLLAYLAKRGVDRRFARLDETLREIPVPIGSQEQELQLPFQDAHHHDPGRHSGGRSN